jgi:hypothetical protein
MFEGFQNNGVETQAFKAAHKESDVDSERGSQHHTLGSGPTQAAPGNHLHIGMTRVYLGTVPPVGWLELDGSVIDQVDYPRFFASAGVSSATLTLPNVPGLIVRVV